MNIKNIWIILKKYLKAIIGTNKLENLYLATDFSDNQIECITTIKI